MDNLEEPNIMTEQTGIGQYMPSTNVGLNPPVPFTKANLPYQEEPELVSNFSQVSKNIEIIKQQYSERIVGQESLKESLLIGLICGGHILVESVPGLAKTTAAHTLANAVQGSFSRIQCTPDLLPSDILGIEIYNQKQGGFKTELGPVHANFVLMDEINRSSAKTQSAMLEAMQEKQTSIGGNVYKLPEPFMVIATQNPIEQEGTYKLPEAQLDRFMLKEILTYPNTEEELLMLDRYDSGVFDSESTEQHSVTLDDILQIQQTAQEVHVEKTIKQYIINIVTATRNVGLFVNDGDTLVEYGASPRASIAFLSAARAVALLEGRDHVIPEDVKHVATRVLRHRIILSYEAEINKITPEKIIETLLSVVPVP